MPLIIPEGYVQVVLNWSSPTFDSGGAATVLGFKDAVPGRSPALVATAVEANTTTYVLPSMHNQVQLSSVYAATADASAEVVSGTVGGQALETPPPNTTMLIKKTTLAKGRRGRGRAYWPGTLGEADVDEQGILPPAVISGWQAIFDEWTEQLLDADLGQVVLQNSEGVTPPLDPPPGVETFVVQPKVATQRRRLRR